MPTIFIMSGLPFSGKSTLSKEISSYLAIPRISFDEVWQEVETQNGFIPGKDSVDQWRYISQICEQKVSDLLQKGFSVVYDNLGDNSTNRDRIRALAKQFHSDATIIYLDVSSDEVIRRRKSNLTTQDRHQVSDENFNRAILSFQPPLKTDKVIIYNPNQDIKSWLDGHFN